MYSSSGCVYCLLVCVLQYTYYFFSIKVKVKNEKYKLALVIYPKTILLLFTLHFYLLTLAQASLLVGLVRFELTHARVKVWCLTAWLQPNVIFNGVEDGTRTHDLQCHKLAR